LRQAVVQILRTSGYRVLEAQTSLEALEIAQSHSGSLDVLLTDIVMPGLRGTELARRVIKSHPEVQGMYMSGYRKDSKNLSCRKIRSFCRSHFDLQRYSNSLNSCGTDPDWRGCAAGGWR
jgi:CheY-like chemotaxis protein